MLAVHCDNVARFKLVVVKRRRHLKRRRLVLGVGLLVERCFLKSMTGNWRPPSRSPKAQAPRSQRAAPPPPKKKSREVRAIKGGGGSRHPKSLKSAICRTSVFFLHTQIDLFFSGALRAPEKNAKCHFFLSKTHHFWTFQKIDPEISAIFFGNVHQNYLLLKK